MDLFEQFSALTPVLTRALLAAVCGGVVGLERELREKPAGLKTNALICLGAASYAHLGELLVTGGGDPTRIAGQVITGMGFIGAGAILREGGAVRGALAYPGK
jgi:putative Mg2+ transporter-C (MgtC) family protein